MTITNEGHRPPGEERKHFVPRKEKFEEDKSGKGLRRSRPKGKEVVAEVDPEAAEIVPGKIAPVAPTEFIEKVIAINRITKVTKGGKKLSFSALVVVGDAKGNVGYSLDKAAEVAIAIRKAMAAAKKSMVKIPMRGTTIPHEIIGACGGARVLLKPASEGTGVIAAGPVRAVCEGAGIHNILTKCHKSNNPINVVKATMDGLSRLKTVGYKN
jgi:small subunit ribosomal protein S5